MNCKESLLWILDKNGQRGWSEENAQSRIDFVHSLGLKCDCVGWARLDLASPRAAEILDAIEAFCHDNGWSARGYYTREFAEPESSWYAIRFVDAKNERVGSTRQVKAEGSGTAEICALKAYQEGSPCPKEMTDLKFVPERFRDACLRLGIEDLDFCWALDKGKYRAEQYFHIYPHHAVAHMAKKHRFYFSRKGLHTFDPEQDRRMKTLGGWLPRLCFFQELRITLPNCYLASELPAGGFSSAHIPGSRWECGFQNILVHADTAAALLREKALSPSCLMPVPVLDAFPDGYTVLSTLRQMPPVPEVREQMLKEYDALQATSRPIRQIKEKEALKLLRKAKADRKEDFHKALPKAQAATLVETEFAPLFPYWRVTSGGWLDSDSEYELLSYDACREATAQFYDQMAREELLDDLPQGIVFGCCPDGDSLVLHPSGIVSRFSHEEPVAIEEWPTLAQFIADTTAE